MESKLLIKTPSFTASGRTSPVPEPASGHKPPLIVAIHGGGFTSEYFDIPGYSLLERAEARGYGVIGLDRMGYGQSRADGKDEQSLASNRDWLCDAIGRLWSDYEHACEGVVLIGHSIGAALALMIAAEPQDWPLAGVAVSGAALAENPALSAYFGNLPADPWIDSPAQDKDRLMLGEAGTFDTDVLERLHPSYRPVSTRELAEIYTVWSDGAPEYLKAITVPVQYRMGEHDALWVVDDDAIATLSTLLSGVEGSSAAAVAEAGHAIDFHKVGARFQEEQLDFALSCIRQ